MNKTKLDILNNLETIILNLAVEERVDIESKISSSKLYSLGKIEAYAVCLQKIKELQIKQKNR